MPIRNILCTLGWPSLVLLLGGCSDSNNPNGGGGTGSGAVFLVGGTDGTQLYSGDARSWTEVLGIPGGYNARGVAFGNGRFVWVGDCGVGCYASSESSATLDNLNYTRTVFGDFTHVYELAFGNGMFVGVGRTNPTPTDRFATAWVSTDGVNWTPHTVADASDLFEIVFGEGLFITDCNGGAVGGGICHSTDGVSWNAVTLTDAQYVADISYGNGTFLAVGNNTTGAPSAWTSPDGINWSAPVDMGRPLNARFYDFGGAAYGNARWVVVGTNTGVAQTWLSDDNGASWSTTTIGGASLQDVIYAQNQFVAVGVGAHITASADGASWTNHDLPGGGGNLNAIAFKP